MINMTKGGIIHSKMHHKREHIPRPIKKTITRAPSIEKSLVENLIELQKVHTDLAEKFDKLTKQIADLLALFEMTARSFATHPGVQASEKDKEFLEKIDKLLEQNKTIARGLTLMEERVRERVYGGHPTHEHFNNPVQQSHRDMEEEKLQPSISNTNKPLPKF
jgi:hypothetical protein